MKYSLTTTPARVIEPASVARNFMISAGNFSTAVAVYVQPQGTKNVIVILDSDATSKVTLQVPAGRSLEAYTDAGTANLAVSKISAIAE